eukprot:CAMPEP_0203813732 /NCGR_PEP_ID=MMETSP0115-20131106/4886_1 /ASSEMBLY_ACC=CAM_ASM_000227 /TAXON_ID=33651 /ORGANISM="Bicosoecid sp, Strain ms1" /LENGTH=241 /DNA_ID=CAMNT_0050722607 /DNA_START=17 /DNA_END=743 /DNA_ORIENTATION=+
MCGVVVCSGRRPPPAARAGVEQQQLAAHGVPLAAHRAAERAEDLDDLRLDGGPSRRGGSLLSRERERAREAAREGGGDREGAAVDMAMPVFHDAVKRSTRFATSVPASEVLRRIEEVLNAEPHPLPPPFEHIRQQVRVLWNKYKLEVLWGGTVVCTVQVYLRRAGLYIVEFTRGNVDIFKFKRFYEELRQHLAEVVKHESSLSLLSLLPSHDLHATVGSRGSHGSGHGSGHDGDDDDAASV